MNIDFKYGAPAPLIWGNSIENMKLFSFVLNWNGHLIFSITVVKVKIDSFTFCKMVEKAKKQGDHFALQDHSGYHQWFENYTIKETFVRAEINQYS